MIPQKMKSLAVFETEGVDLSIMRDIQVDVRQISRCGEVIFQKTYTPLILPDNAFGIVIPKEDAAKLQNDNSVAVSCWQPTQTATEATAAPCMWVWTN